MAVRVNGPAKTEFERIAPRLALAHKQAIIHERAVRAYYTLADAYWVGNLIRIRTAQNMLSDVCREIEAIF
jgi:hypothetical protein